MAGYLRRHHLALLALFVALGGTSFAAVKLSKNSVGAKQIKRSAVRSAEVKNATLLEADFKPGQLPEGQRGDQGPPGPAGDDGEAGEAGPRGPSGVVDTRTVSGMSSSVPLAGNMGASVVTPAACRTGAHTAGPGEVAVIDMQVTGSPSAASNNVLYLDVMASENLAPYTAVSGQSQADTLSVGTTHVTNSHVQPLTAGTIYQWGAGLASNDAVTLTVAFCSGSVTIYRKP